MRICARKLELEERTNITDSNFLKKCFLFLKVNSKGIYIFATRVAATLSALTHVSKRYFAHPPMILYGIFPIAASISIYFLPETFNLPFPDTIKDMEER
jgi:hypothetical protein